MTLAPDTTDTTIDFAYKAGATPYSISGTVFEDAGSPRHLQRRRGRRRAQVPGATVTLYRVVGGVQYLIGTTTTDGTGDYSFTDLPAGTYVVKVDTTGTIATAPADGGLSRPERGGVRALRQPVHGDARRRSVANINFGYWNGGIVTTPVTLAYFKATSGKKKGSVDFEWWTATETGNLGFELYVEAGKKLVRVNPEPIRGKVTSTEPVHYTYTAEGVEGDTFWIEDVSSRAASAPHGRTSSARRSGTSRRSTPIDWKAVKKEKGDKKAARDQKLRQDARGGGTGRSESTATAQRHCRRSGRAARAGGCRPVRTTYAVSGRVYRVTYETLLGGRHGSEEGAAQPPGALQPRAAGADQRGRRRVGKTKDLFGAGSYLEFVGEGEISLYTDANPYRLVVEKANGAARGGGRRTLPARLRGTVLHGAGDPRARGGLRDRVAERGSLVRRVPVGWPGPSPCSGRSTSTSTCPARRRRARGRGVGFELS